MIRCTFLIGVLLSAFQLCGCGAIPALTETIRIDKTISENADKQLVPKDGKTYLIPIGQEAAYYFGTGETDWKINETSFAQPIGTYSVIRVTPGTYTAYGNHHSLLGGAASSSILVNAGEVVCFYPLKQPDSTHTMKTFRGAACEAILHKLKNENAVLKIK